MEKTKRISKTLLRNLIRQTETHNRIVEEEECWRQYEAQQASKSTQYGIDTSPLDVAPRPSQRTFKYRQKANDDRVDVPSQRGKFQAHMDDVDETQPRVYADRFGERREASNFWLQQFDAAESSDPNRWGHSGYKELYPQEFQLPRPKSETTSDSESSTRSQANADTEYSSKLTTKTGLKLDRHRKKKKSKKHKRKRSSSQSSETNDKHRTRAKKRKKKTEDGTKKKKKRHS